MDTIPLSRWQRIQGRAATFLLGVLFPRNLRRRGSDADRRDADFSAGFKEDNEALRRLVDRLDPEVRALLNGFTTGHVFDALEAVSLWLDEELSHSQANHALLSIDGDASVGATKEISRLLLGLEIAQFTNLRADDSDEKRPDPRLGQLLLWMFHAGRVEPRLFPHLSVRSSTDNHLVLARHSGREPAHERWLSH